VSVFSGTSTAVNRDDRRIVELFGGAAGWDAIKHPDRVEAYLIKFAGQANTGGDKYVGGCEIIGGPFSVVERDVNELVQALKNPQTYMWDDNWLCIMIPGVGIRFQSQSRVVDLVFCFYCGRVEVYADGNGVGSVDLLRPGNRELSRIMKSIFPHDAEIQKL
jgi:hypothetical protein